MQDNQIGSASSSPWMLKSEVCDTFRTSAATVDAMVRDGVLPAYRIGNLVRFKRAEVEALITPVVVK